MVIISGAVFFLDRGSAYCQFRQIIYIGIQNKGRQIVKMDCDKALQAIKVILEDHTLADRECFEKIVQIICVFEDFGSMVEGRHDFG